MPDLRAQVFGNYNIIVQAVGDNTTINISQPFLVLTAWHRRQSNVTKVLDLLNPFQRAVPLAGMERLRAELLAWLRSSSRISVRCITGHAGSGKTRLGIELCSLSEEQGWHAGFIRDQELVRFANQQNLESWNWSKETLIVVDYAAAKSAILRKWFVELAVNTTGATNRLRVLLLERHSDIARGWWHDLTTPGGFSEEPIAELFDPATPVAAEQIDDVETRRPSSRQ